MIARQKEQVRLLALAESGESEFVAVYGRRRVGKTYLVRTTFEGEFTFAHSGVANVSNRKQLQSFRMALREQGLADCPALADWLTAFEQLKRLVEASSRKRKILFIDEMPWMDAPKSDFVPALEHFWNDWASSRRDVLLVVCGSATSWIIRKVLKNRGGLHNRITEKMLIRPFTLRECREYAAERALDLTDAQIAELYMVLGGIPFYWRFLRRGMSPAQDIDELFFSEDGRLVGEFDELYASLFKNPEPHIRIVEALSRHTCGMTRDEISRAAGIANGGNLTRCLEDLEQCGFIRKYHVVDRPVNGGVYQLIDNYTLFYNRFVRENVRRNPRFWSENLGKGVYHAWRGLAFERLSLLHVREIKASLQVAGVASCEYAWRSRRADPGAQVDLVIDRDDGIVDLCEMKCTNEPFALDAEESRRILHRKEAFAAETGTRKAIHVILVSATGLVTNAYAHDIMHVVTLADLMAP